MSWPAPNTCDRAELLRWRRLKPTLLKDDGEKNDVTVCAEHRDRAALLRGHRQDCLCYLTEQRGDAGAYAEEAA